MSLLEDARAHIANEAAGLTGEHDFAPFLAMSTPFGPALLQLEMPDEPYRDQVADVMIAMIMLHEATEAVFGSCAWIAEAHSRADLPADIATAPNRREIAFMVHATIDGAGGMFHEADITRQDGTVTIGTWRPDNISGLGGRFVAALRYGLQLVTDTPPEIREHLHTLPPEQRLAFLGPALSALAARRAKAKAAKN